MCITKRGQRKDHLSSHGTFQLAFGPISFVTVSLSGPLLDPHTFELLLLMSCSLFIDFLQFIQPDFLPLPFLLEYFMISV